MAGMVIGEPTSAPVPSCGAESQLPPQEKDKFPNPGPPGRVSPKVARAHYLWLVIKLGISLYLRCVLRT